MKWRKDGKRECIVSGPKHNRAEAIDTFSADRDRFGGWSFGGQRALLYVLDHHTPITSEEVIATTPRLCCRLYVHATLLQQIFQPTQP